MADLTTETPIGVAWTNVSDTLGWTAGSSHLVDFRGIDYSATPYHAETDSDSVAPTIDGHPITAAARQGAIPPRLYEQKANIYLWVRLSQGAGTLVTTER